MPELTSAAAVVNGAWPDVLGRIAGPGVELALWRRSLPAALVRWLEALPPGLLPTARVELDAAGDANALHAACDAAGTPGGYPRDLLVADIARLVARFATVSGSRAVRLRLEAIAGDACRRLHRDCVPLRLLTTYRGPGTEWVAPEHAADAIARPDDYTGPLQRLPPHAVALFKGCGFPGQAHDRGVVHRSPRVEGTGITRLVLCLNVPVPAPQLHLAAGA